MGNNKLKNMREILQLKHWQLFLILLPIFILASFEFESEQEAKKLYFLNIIGSAGILIWSFIQTFELIKLLPKTIKLNTNLYYINAFLVFTIMIGGLIISKGEQIHFDGIYALLGIYIIYAFFQSFGFAGRIIKSLEIKCKSRKRDSIGYFFLYLFSPIGIWILQPKINKQLKHYKL